MTVLDWNAPTIISADIRAIDAWRERELELAVIRDFKEDWDGRGSAAATVTAMNVAALFLSICKEIKPSDPPERIYLTPEGVLSAEWLHGKTLVRAEVYEDDRIEWMVATPGRETKFFITALTGETMSNTEQVQMWQPAPVAEEEHALAFAR